ncbi:MAG: ABC transporter permease, partial [Anaerolineales bacterium]
VTLRIRGRDTEWQIAGVYSISGSIDYALVYTTYEYLSRLGGFPGQVYSIRVETQQHDLESTRLAADGLRDVFELNSIPLGYVELASEWREQQKSQTDVMVYFMLIMAILTAIVGGLGLMGTMSINTLERTREIGVMRAIGADNADIQWIVLVEGLFIGLVSWLVSILLSIPITMVLVVGVGEAVFDGPLPFTFGPLGVTVWLFGTLLIAGLASSLPARRASRLTIRDTLAYE